MCSDDHFVGIDKLDVAPEEAQNVQTQRIGPEKSNPNLTHDQMPRHEQFEDDATDDPTVPHEHGANCADCHHFALPNGCWGDPLGLQVQFGDLEHFYESNVAYTVQLIISKLGQICSYRLSSFIND